MITRALFSIEAGMFQGMIIDPLKIFGGDNEKTIVDQWFETSESSRRIAF
jgi:hypothetical protein